LAEFSPLKSENYELRNRRRRAENICWTVNNSAMYLVC